MKKITIIKRDAHGKVRWQYGGSLLSLSDREIVIEAFFDRDSTVEGNIIINKGDRFVETYYTDQWYDILEIHDRDDDHIKGWYCDIGFPVKQPSDDCLYFDDLELDLLVNADGEQMVLDMERFESLDIDPETREKALTGLKQVRDYFKKLFGKIDP
ncbi:MAG TPA: DUF402 domain-containing protein [Anaerolineales bacterium]|nr:DUF402 domain-containing protein [Anaerolineales bacterium]